MYIIADPGSCHLGKIHMAKDLITAAADCGADAVKFQLFKTAGTNIPLPYDWMPELVGHGTKNEIDVFASVWDEDGMEALELSNCESIKFAHSQRWSKLVPAAIEKFKTVYVSWSRLDDFYEETVNLYCVPDYPVEFTIDFEGVFPRFDGFSSHAGGIKQDVEAVRNGAQVIEKHIRLNNRMCETVPDGKFALKPEDFRKMVYKIGGVQ